MQNSARKMVARIMTRARVRMKSIMRMALIVRATATIVKMTPRQGAL
jgi:hypothetical protein